MNVCAEEEMSRILALGLIGLLFTANVSCSSSSSGGSSASSASVTYALDGWGLAIDGANVYVTSAGYQYSDGVSNEHKWRVDKSTNNGSTWANSELATAANYYSFGILSVGSGTLYTSGFYSRAITIRKTSDAGATWATVDSNTYSSTNTYVTNYKQGLAVDGSGNIFAAYAGFDGNNDSHWLVRKGTSSGTVWATVDDYIVNNVSTSFTVPTFASGPRSVAVDSGNNVYVVGTIFKESTSENFWVVRKSTDAGSTWAVVDEYQYSAGRACEANDVVIDGSDNLYVTGRCYNGTDYVWITRKSTNGGAAWAVVDNYQYSSGPVTSGLGLAVTGTTLYAVGVGFSSTSSSTGAWIVRKSTDSGATWAVSETFQLTSGQPSAATEVAIDGSGYIYVTGAAKSSSASSDLLVRKSTDAGATWATVYQQNYTGTSGLVLVPEEFAPIEETFKDPIVDNNPLTVLGTGTNLGSGFFNPKLR